MEWSPHRKDDAAPAMHRLGGAHDLLAGLRFDCCHAACPHRLSRTSNRRLDADADCPVVQSRDGADRFG
jgi:hypothetical protein